MLLVDDIILVDDTRDEVNTLLEQRRRKESGGFSHLG